MPKKPAPVKKSEPKPKFCPMCGQRMPMGEEEGNSMGEAMKKAEENKKV